MSGKIVRFGNTERVKKKVEECRKAGVKVSENKMSATITATYNGEEVLSCSFKSTDKWVMTYNSKFWDEYDIDNDGNIKPAED